MQHRVSLNRCCCGDAGETPPDGKACFICANGFMPARYELTMGGLFETTTTNPFIRGLIDFFNGNPSVTDVRGPSSDCQRQRAALFRDIEFFPDGVTPNNEIFYRGEIFVGSSPHTLTTVEYSIRWVLTVTTQGIPPFGPPVVEQYRLRLGVIHTNDDLPDCFETRELTYASDLQNEDDGIPSAGIDASAVSVLIEAA